MEEKQGLEDTANACRRKMAIAAALTNGLAGEKMRWTATSAELGRSMELLLGDALATTAALSYAGPFNEEYRTLLASQWGLDMATRAIPSSANVDLVSFFTTPRIINQWQLAGLPTDKLSSQNGVIATKVDLLCGFVVSILGVLVGQSLFESINILCCLLA